MAVWCWWFYCRGSCGSCVLQKWVSCRKGIPWNVTASTQSFVSGTLFLKKKKIKKIDQGEDKSSHTWRDVYTCINVWRGVRQKQLPCMRSSKQLWCAVPCTSIVPRRWTRTFPERVLNRPPSRPPSQVPSNWPTTELRCFWLISVYSSLHVMLSPCSPVTWCRLYLICFFFFTL